jgi:hypothetical protein
MRTAFEETIPKTCSLGPEGESLEACSKSPGFSPFRQAQIVAGTLLLAAFFFAPLRVLVPVVGAGLLLAGFTGLCPMNRLLARMPWNRS